MSYSILSDTTKTQQLTSEDRQQLDFLVELLLSAAQKQLQSGAENSYIVSSPNNSAQ